MSTTDARIYVASLSDYNAGRLVGAWIDLNGKDTDEVQEEIAAMLTAAGPGREEWEIHDKENIPDGTGKLSLAALCAVANIDHPCAWDIATGGYCDPADTGEWIEEHARGEWDDLADYAESMVRDCVPEKDIPAMVRNYIDYESLGRDLELGGDVFTIEKDGRCYVFDNH